MSNNLTLLISRKLSELAGKLTPGNPNFWSTVAFPDKSINHPYLLSFSSSSCKFLWAQFESLINLLTERFLPAVFVLLKCFTRFWGIRTFCIFLLVSATPQLPFLLLDSLIHTSTGMYAGILSIQSLISMLLYTNVQKYDLSLLDS